MVRGQNVLSRQIRLFFCGVAAWFKHCKVAIGRRLFPAGLLEVGVVDLMCSWVPKDVLGGSVAGT